MCHALEDFNAKGKAYRIQAVPYNSHGYGLQLIQDGQIRAQIVDLTEKLTSFPTSVQAVFIRALLGLAPDDIVNILSGKPDQVTRRLLRIKGKMYWKLETTTGQRIGMIMKMENGVPSAILMDYFKTHEDWFKYALKHFPSHHHRNLLPEAGL